MLDEIVHGSFTVGKEGKVMKLQEHEVFTDENGRNWRIGYSLFSYKHFLDV